MKIAPIAIIVFNRPDTTRKVLDAISKVKPSQLFIIADAPREGNKEDEVLCKEVIQLFKNLNWDCDVKLNIASKNMGVGIRPYTGIDWVFETVDRAIILEDDILPSKSFLEFSTELLDRYIDSENIMHISGTRFCEEYNTKNNDSYLFSRYPNISGWATWRRAWKKYDHSMSNFNSVKQSKYLEYLFNEHEKNHWNAKFERAIQNKDRIWDYQWQYTVLIHNGLCIYPTSNLVSNIGPFGSTINLIMSIYFRNIDYTYSIKHHPELIIVNRKFDEYYYDHFLNPNKTFFQKLARKIFNTIIKYSPNRISSGLIQNKQNQLLRRHLSKINKNQNR